MTATPGALAPALVKEVRALAPTYCAALGAVAVGNVSDSYTLIALGLLGFAFGAVALGAQSFGLEYSHRTLGLLLSQPIDRRRTFLYKAVVLSVMLVTLTAAVLVLYDDLLKRAASPHTDPAMLMLAAACGLFLAPWLTMLCRSTLAAIVFTIAIPGLLSTGADLVGALVYGLQDADAIDRFKLLVFWRGMFLICALGGLSGFLMFMRLEVIEGHAHVQLSGSLAGDADTLATAAAPGRQPWLWALVTKELRVQQMTFVVAAVFALLSAGLMWVDRSRPESSSLPLVPITMLYIGLLAMLIGSLASADERQFGTLEWQMLQPIPAWQQWAVKVGVVWGLGLLFGVGLSTMLGYLGRSGELFTPRAALQVASTTILLTTGSVYISTLCRSGVGALVVSFPSVLATSLLTMTIGNTIGPLAVRLSDPGGRPYLGLHDVVLLLYALGAGLVALLLWFAFLNHRSADRGLARTSKQVLAIAGYITVGLAALIVLGVG